MKALRWWAPNVIAGIPDIYCGLRDDNRETIKKIEIIKTKELATDSYTKDPITKQKSWDSGHCIRTLENVLSRIKVLVPEDDEGAFKQAVLTIRSGDGGLGMKPTIEIREREENDRFVEEDEIQLIFKGNE